MYDNTFFFISWGFMYALVLPILFFTIIGIVYEALSKDSDKKEKIYSIDEIQSAISNTSLGIDECENILKQFIDNYSDFDSGDDVDKKIAFIYNLALIDSFDIERSNSLKDKLISKNPKSKKEIEKKFSEAFKEREKKNKKRK